MRCSPFVICKKNNQEKPPSPWEKTHRRNVNVKLWPFDFNKLHRDLDLNDIIKEILLKKSSLNCLWKKHQDWLQWKMLFVKWLDNFNNGSQLIRNKC